eukprot:m.83946 g.83946  ORF g.83946 m.83946 type:complete len:419 (-) comp14667_c0_seq3:85-1341(-)
MVAKADFPDGFSVWFTSLLLIFVALSNLLFVALRRFWSAWGLLSLRHQRNLVTYILEIVVTTMMLGVQLSITTLIGNPDSLSLAARANQAERAEKYIFTPLVALYVFEMIYRTKLGWELWLHHGITVLLSLLMVQTVRTDGSIYTIRVAYVVVLTATTEQMSFVALAYRIYRIGTELEHGDEKEELVGSGGDGDGAATGEGGNRRPSLQWLLDPAKPGVEPLSDYDLDQRASFTDRTPASFRRSSSRRKERRRSSVELFESRGPGSRPSSWFESAVDAALEAEDEPALEECLDVDVQPARVFSVEARLFRIAAITTLLFKSTCAVGGFVLVGIIGDWNMDENSRTWHRFWIVFFILINTTLLFIQIFAAHILWILSIRARTEGQQSHLSSSNLATDPSLSKGFTTLGATLDNALCSEV